MQVNLHIPFRQTLAFLTVVFSLMSTSSWAQTSGTATTDEQLIRDLVAQQNKTPNQRLLPLTDESIFWSGAYPRPTIGKQQSPENRAITEQMKTERLNYQSTARIERLVIAQSGDIAYEYGNGTLSWDTPQQKHVQFDNAYLRTWKKTNGQWQVDAFFARPLDTRMVENKK